jgi:hypothetical protein
VTDDQGPVTLEAGGHTTTPTTQGSGRLAGVSLSTMAGLVTAVFAIAGAFWFGLLSLAAAIAYAPAGVRPREIGLSSGTVLAQSAIGVAAWIGIYTVVTLLYSFILFRPWRRYIRRKLTGAALVYAQILSFGRYTPRYRPQLAETDDEDDRESSGALPRLPPVVATLIVLTVLFAAVYTVLLNAREAADALRDGRTSGAYLSLGANPWSAEIAELAWVAEKPEGVSAPPRCVLYLGEAGGTTVIYAAAEHRTWRLPSSAVIVTTSPERSRC